MIFHTYETTESSASVIPFETFTLSSSGQHPGQSLKASSLRPYHCQEVFLEPSLNLPHSPVPLIPAEGGSPKGLLPLHDLRVPGDPILERSVAVSLTHWAINSLMPETLPYSFPYPLCLDIWSSCQRSTCNTYSGMLTKSDLIWLYRGTITFHNLCV